MNTVERAHYDAALSLSSGSYHDETLEGAALPDVQDAHGVRFAQFGPKDAQHVILESAPYLTPLDKSHYLLRLRAQQAVLGEDYSVIGVEAFKPAGGFSREDRKAFATGSFSLLAANVLRVAEATAVDDEQHHYAYGYSLGADVSVQTAYDVRTNPNRGVINLKGLGAIETARVADRGFMVIKAMGDSGKGLARNIMASDSPALEEAWDVNADMSFADVEKKIGKGVNAGIAGYMRSGVLANLALIRGFGTDKSVSQLNLLAHTDLPVVLGRQEGSTVCPPEFIDRYADKPHFVTYTETGNDHSADDNLVGSAGRILHFARAVS